MSIKDDARKYVDDGFQAWIDTKIPHFDELAPNEQGELWGVYAGWMTGELDGADAIPEFRSEVFKYRNDKYKEFDRILPSASEAGEMLVESGKAMFGTAVGQSINLMGLAHEAVTGEDLPEESLEGALQKATGAQATQQFQGAKRFIKGVFSGDDEEVDATYDDIINDFEQAYITGEKWDQDILDKKMASMQRRAARLGGEDPAIYEGDERKDILSLDNKVKLLNYLKTGSPDVKKELKDELTLSTTMLDARDREKEAVESQEGMAKFFVEYGTNPAEAALTAAEFMMGFGVVTKAGRMTLKSAAKRGLLAGGLESTWELAQLMATDPNALSKTQLNTLIDSFLLGGGISGVGSTSKILLESAKDRKAKLEAHGEPEAKPESPVDDERFKPKADQKAEPTAEPDVTAPVSPLTPEEQKELDELEEIAEVGEIKLSDDMQGRLDELRKKEAQPVPEPVQEEVVVEVQEDVITKEADDLIKSGGVPFTVTSNLKRIAEENGIEVTKDKSAQDIIDELKAKKEATPEPEALTEADEAELQDELDEELGQVEVDPIPEPEGPRPRLPVGPQGMGNPVQEIQVPAETDKAPTTAPARKERVVEVKPERTVNQGLTPENEAVAPPAPEAPAPVSRDFEDRTELARTKRAQVDQEVDKLKKDMGLGDNDIEVVDVVEDLPESIREDAIEYTNEDGLVEGLWDPETGKAYIVASDVMEVVNEDGSKRTVRQVFAHEVIGHGGMQPVLGSGFNNFMQGVWDKHKKSPTMKAIMRDTEKTGKTAAERLMLAEEYVARLAENTAIAPGLWGKIVEAVKQWTGNPEAFSDADIKRMLIRSRQEVQNRAAERSRLEETAKTEQARVAEQDKVESEIRKGQAALAKERQLSEQARSQGARAARKGQSISQKTKAANTTKVTKQAFNEGYKAEKKAMRLEERQAPLIEKIEDAGLPMSDLKPGELNLLADRSDVGTNPYKEDARKEIERREESKAKREMQRADVNRSEEVTTFIKNNMKIMHPDTYKEQRPGKADDDLANLYEKTKYKSGKAHPIFATKSSGQGMTLDQVWRSLTEDHGFVFENISEMNEAILDSVSGQVETYPHGQTISKAKFSKRKKVDSPIQKPKQNNFDKATKGVPPDPNVDNVAQGLSYMAQKFAYNAAGYMFERGSIPVFARKILKRSGERAKSVETMFTEQGKRINKALNDNSLGDNELATNSALMDMAVRGNDQALQDLKPELAQLAREARASIDMYSEQLISDGVVDGKLAEKVGEKIGSYITRKYKLFDPAFKWNYATVKKNHPKIYEAGIQEILKVARENDQQMTRTEADAIVRSMLDASRAEGKGSFIFGTSFGKIDTSSFIKRKNLSQPIRELLGEIRDPAINIAFTGQRVGQALSSYNAQRMIRDGLIRNGLASPVKDLSKRHDVRLSDDKLGSMAGFGELWMAPELAQAFEETLANIQSKKWSPSDLILRTITGLSAIGKFAQVILNPGSYPTNLAGAFFTELANGRLSFKGGRAVFQSTKGDRLFKLKNYTPQMQQTFYNKTGKQWLSAGGKMGTKQLAVEMEAGGIRDNSVFAGDLVGAVTKVGIGDKALRATKWASSGYQAFDNMSKRNAYMSELTKWAKAKPDATMAEITELAAADVKATTQNYDMVPKILKELSQRGMVVGTYISFTSELFRNTAGTFNLAQKELRSGNPELMKAGAKRVAGIALTAGVLYSMFHDKTEDEEEKRWAINEIAKPPWNDGQRLWMLDDDKGRIRYADPAYMIPHAYFYNIIANFTSASLEGEPGRGVSDALTAFGSVTDMNIFMQTAMEIAMNKKESGAPIYNEAQAETDALYKGGEVAKHIIKNMYTPGFVRTMDKIEKAQKGEPGFKGVVATQDDLEAQFLSIRPVTIDQHSKRFQVDTFRPLARSLREANMIDSDSKMVGKTEAEQLELIAKQEEVTEVFVEKTKRAVKAMGILGISRGRIRAAMKEAGIPKAVQRQAFRKPKSE